jgi:hypothetical protein
LSGRLPPFRIRVKPTESPLEAIEAVEASSAFDLGEFAISLAASGARWRTTPLDWIRISSTAARVELVDHRGVEDGRILMGEM